MIKSYYEKSEVRTKKKLFKLLDKINNEAGIKYISFGKSGGSPWSDRITIYAFIQLKRNITIYQFNKCKEIDYTEICMGDKFTSFGKEVEKMKRWIMEWVESNNVYMISD